MMSGVQELNIRNTINSLSTNWTTRRYNLQSATRLGVKLDFMAGLFAKGIATNGTDEFRGVQVALGAFEARQRAQPGP